VLHPLAVGLSWTYVVEPVGGGVVCPPGTHTSTVETETTLDGRQAFAVTNWCPAAGTSFLSPGEGDEVFLNYDSTWLPMIALPLQDGFSWDYFNTSFTWEDAGSVTVPAGTFDDCWTARQNVSYDAFLTYCRGIGMVQSHSSDLNGQGWDAQLSVAP
jgi:hypothetical protein